MSTHSPSAYSISLILHGAFAAAILVTAFVLKEDTARKTTEIFELVQGAGDNWAATEAPALGTPDGVKFQAPPAPVAQPLPEPVAPTPQPAAPEPVVHAAPVEAPPVTPTPVQAVTPPKTETKKVIPEKTLAQQFKQAAARKERATTNQYRKEEAKKEAAAKAKQAAADAEAAKKAKMTLAEFKRLNGKTPAANSKQGAALAYQKVSTQGISGGVAEGKGSAPGAGGPALSRAEQDQLGTYFAMLIQRLKAAHEKPFGVTDQLTARISFYISASGAINQVKVVRSSGNAEFDRSAIAAFSKVGSLGPRPDDRGDTREITFDMSDAE